MVPTYSDPNPHVDLGDDPDGDNTVDANDPGPVPDLDAFADEHRPAAEDEPRPADDGWTPANARSRNDRDSLDARVANLERRVLVIETGGSDIDKAAAIESAPNLGA